MKKLYTLKSWFSLGDAAERLGAGLGEGVSVNDVLQLVVEELLPLSWYIRHVPARRVAPYTALRGRGYSPEFFQMQNCFFPDKEFPQDQLIISEEWECVDGEESIVYLDGPHRLELKYCGALMDWIHAHLTNTGGELISLDGFFVSDNEGTIWQIMEHRPRSRYKTSDGEEKEMAACYHPSGVFPEEAELIIQRQDIEAFERSLSESPDTEPNSLLQRTETSYLNMIAALLDVIKEGIPSLETSMDRIGPAAEFKSEAKLISAIAHHYRGIDGLSKRNLEQKFPAAKRNLNTSY
ncbi:MAG: hypothetical protein N0E55_13235 [Candidatus Thiodiazotropha taylori]|nr:hypothetical protein [Candidatus Thiodiazotropha taylori]MCG8096756.1 hypothetical protein [Candidatus Thiodiazotropha endolucinida]MCG8105550.1 hypothetical protein [Candidatus Thiodiazotropha taylori]MCG8111215.1 hypothetical protein [Candidatus Thiodiazotropha taylori]MCG8124904.1 hypothetical protein [Candidatus Thiodiazotropha taylori]